MAKKTGRFVLYNPEGKEVASFTDEEMINRMDETILRLVGCSAEINSNPKCKRPRTPRDCGKQIIKNNLWSVVDVELIRLILEHSTELNLDETLDDYYENKEEE